MRDEHMYYRMVNDRLETAGKSGSAPDQDKLLCYLFLCLAYELKQDRDTIIYQEPVWSDPETTFSIVMYRSDGVSHNYCCSCIEVLGGSWQRECGPVTTAYMKSKEERDEIKSRFMVLLNVAQEQLSDLDRKTPQEYFFLKTCPVIKEVASTESKHFVVLQADVQDAVDRLCVEETMQPWTDYERIRDYYEISFEGDRNAEIRMVFYRLRKQKKFVWYLKNLGLEDLYGTGT